jgi:hypothetical protein
MLVHISLPPHVRPRLRDPLAMPVFRVVARSSLFSAPLFSPPPARPPLALALAPCPRCQTTAGGGPRCRRRFRGRAGWFVLGCLSLLLSLNTYCPGSFLSFFSQCLLGCTHDTIQLHDVTWHSPPATRGFNTRYDTIA